MGREVRLSHKSHNQKNHVAKFSINQIMSGKVEKMKKR
jgi:hypothetical protein